MSLIIRHLISLGMIEFFEVASLRLRFRLGTFGSVRATKLAVTWVDDVWLRIGVSQYSFLSWLLCMNQVNTFARLEYFGMHMDPHCLLCVRNVESTQHLFISYPYASSILDVLVRQDLI